jgi:hypothetical protein
MVHITIVTGAYKPTYNTKIPGLFHQECDVKNSSEIGLLAGLSKTFLAINRGGSIVMGVALSINGNFRILK